MLRRFFQTRSRNAKIIRQLYAALVAAARQPAFYQDFAVPDTLEGRFHMIVLHIFLLFYRLKQCGERGKTLTQALFDLFCLDMDRSLRELGVSDTRVPKQMKKMMQAFYGALQAYEKALLADGAASTLAAPVRERVFGPPGRNGAPEEEQACAQALARYMLEGLVHLDGLSCEAIAAGRLSFPAPPVKQAETA